jgi:hypothetical protein
MGNRAVRKPCYISRESQLKSSKHGFNFLRGSWPLGVAASTNCASRASCVARSVRSLAATSPEGDEVSCLLRGHSAMLVELKRGCLSWPRVSIQ